MKSATVVKVRDTNKPKSEVRNKKTIESVKSVA